MRRLECDEECEEQFDNVDFEAEDKKKNLLGNSD